MKLSQLVLLLQTLIIGLVNVTQCYCKCLEKCGNVTIHYPFGTQEGCYMDKSYYIECDLETQVPRLNQAFSSSEGSTRSLEVIEVRLDGHLTVNLPIAHACYDGFWSLLNGSTSSYYTSRFPFSSTDNVFFGLGRYIEAHVKLAKPVVNAYCITDVYSLENTNNDSCLGFECCKMVIPPNMTYAKIAVTPNKNKTKVFYSNMCGYAFLVDKYKFNFDNGDHSILTTKKSFPVVLDWSVGNATCEEAQKKGSYMCQDKSICINGEDSFLGYQCKCPQGYMGNAYIPFGCQDVNECDTPGLNDCLPGHCKNTYGSFICVHPKQSHSGNTNTSIIKGIIEGVIGAALTIFFVYWRVKHMRKIEVRQDFFKQNGGIMLQEMLLICKDSGNKVKIFTEEELNKATKNFNDANVIGQGGYGMVYKGILANKTIVAIKKSKVTDQSQVKQFVNEVIILSKINHPNIVEFYGCCLETHVPLLVYEYVTNDTLCHHIHTRDPMLTFEKRLKISEDIAEALFYMHSTINIIHRDVKPSNVLLNDDFTAKVSDFGISRFVPPDQTHLSTFVKGTVGYVDPEYFRTCNLTEKSDVYSFGVVLVELLTGKNIQSLGISLIVHKGAAAYFVSQLEQNALVKVLDDQLKRDEYTKVVKCFAKIAVSCLDLEAKTRPTMKEIKQELKQLRCLLLSIEADSIYVDMNQNI